MSVYRTIGPTLVLIAHMCINCVFWQECIHDPATGTNCGCVNVCLNCFCLSYVYIHIFSFGERTGLVVRASDSGSGDPGSILGRVGVLFP